MTMADEYLKRFVGWATVLRERYTTDLFFRTTVHIVALQGLLVALCIFSFLWALGHMSGQINAAVIENLETLITNYPTFEEGALPTEIDLIQLRGVWLGFSGVVVLAILFGILIARFTLRPARETLRHQKLFISNVAHELRTPLSTIKTSTEVALLDPSLSSGQRKVLLEILGELDRISEIINNLLSLNTFTRPERMQFADVDLGPLTDLVVGRHHALAQEREIKVVNKRDNYCTVWGNASALEQVITNLLRNALSFTPKGKGGIVSISIHPDYHGAIVLSISDTGVGIAQKDLLHIFEPFYQASVSRARTGATGSGLGLTIVNEIIRVHQGKIHIESAKNKGTTVSVFLPVGTEGEGTPEHGGSTRSEVSLDFTRREPGKEIVARS